MSIESVLAGHKPYTILAGDCRALLSSLPENSVQTCITSPPYWRQRRYLDEDDPNRAYELGSEPTIEEFVANLVDVFRHVRRVLRPDGCAWINLGDGYTNGGRAGSWSTVSHEDGGKAAYTPTGGLGPKQLIGAPWRVALALQADGWILRAEVIWHKNNSTPESADDRPTRAHEQVFLLARQEDYYYNADAIRERTGNEMSWDEYRARTVAGATWQSGGLRRHAGANKHDGGKSHPLGRNRRSVWSVPSQALDEAHFATFPPALIEPMVLAGSRAGDVVLDPFNGAGTTGLVAARLGRRYVGLELNPAYVEISERRIAADMQVRQALAYAGQELPARNSSLDGLPLFNALQEVPA